MEVYFENTQKPHHKFYRLEMELVLFDVCLRREWGRIGRAKREKVECFKTWKEAGRVYRRLYRRRIQHGYAVTVGGRTVQPQLPFEKKEKQRDSVYGQKNLSGKKRRYHRKDSRLLGIGSNPLFKW